ncbi:MAG: hypothetical protein A4E52_00431 [Pelotomaculum sp. PtaB.Bin013]|nr:MAG: hypothetical protein A4E52_00431 [Pelotomaculum sp. PtaB.Bin013]
MSPEAKARRRANRRLGKKGLERKNNYGITDLTPYNMVRQLKGKNIIMR